LIARCVPIQAKGRKKNHPTRRHFFIQCVGNEKRPPCTSAGERLKKKADTPALERESIIRFREKKRGVKGNSATEGLISKKGRKGGPFTVKTHLIFRRRVKNRFHPHELIRHNCAEEGPERGGREGNPTT